MNKQALYDGTIKVNRIHVMGMYRNNEKYLDYLFTTFKLFEDKYDVEFRYYFIENNSNDETPTKLKEFIKAREGSKLIIFNLKKDYVNVKDGRNFNRTSTLAKIRNKLVDHCVPFPEDEWCLLIDSNIYFKADILTQVFKEATAPTENNIGMMVMYTQQLFIPEIHKTSGDKPTLMKHFYDTYSFYDKHNKTFYPYCGFEKCMVCSKHASKCMDRKHIKESEPIIDINSGFGGFVFIRSNIINNRKVRWNTLSYEVQDDKSLCEHVLFCDRLRTITEKRIVMLQNVDGLYRTI
jgi:hypothetical protein